MPGVQRARTSGSSASMWMPIASAPASARRSIHARSSGGSICTWMGRNGTRSFTACTQRTRWRAPRSGPLEVPVVMTNCCTPSSATAAAATSASCAGCLTCVVAPALRDSSIVQNRHLVDSSR